MTLVSVADLVAYAFLDDIALHWESLKKLSECLLVVENK